VVNWGEKKKKKEHLLAPTPGRGKKDDKALEKKPVPYRGKKTRGKAFPTQRVGFHHRLTREKRKGGNCFPHRGEDLVSLLKKEGYLVSEEGKKKRRSLPHPKAEKKKT